MVAILLSLCILIQLLCLILTLTLASHAPGNLSTVTPAKTMDQNALSAKTDTLKIRKVNAPWTVAEKETI